MRFVLAIAAFVVAAAMIVLGIAQRTVFLPPSTVAAEGTVDGGLPYTLVSGAVLNARDGSQTVTVTGSDQVFVAYGRTSDVMAWLGDSEYAELSVDEESGALTTTLRGGENPDDPAETQSPAPTDSAPPTDPAAPTDSAEPAAPDAEGAEEADTADEGAAPHAEAETVRNPQGSDLWLSEYVEEQAVIAPISVPEDVSVLIASNGEEAAPDTVRLSWPVSNATPWAGPLIAGGILLLVVGLVLYLLGLNHLRKSRGPRRKGITAGPGLEQTAKPPRRRRRARRSRTSMRAAVPVLLVSGLLLSGCSASYWPDLSSAGETPEPTDSAAVVPETTDDAAAPAVTVPQLERIISRISAVATEADADRNSELAATRFSGAALQERQSNYTIRGKVADYGVPRAIPSSPLLLSLPQATDVWPRTVFTVVGDQEDTATPLIALMLRQETPRSNYTVDYAVSLEPNATIPESAPASVGAAFIPPDSPLMLVAPNNIAASYSDLIAKGAESEWAPLFTESDPFREIIASDRTAKDEGLEETATIEFASAPGETEPLGLATISSGAIVAVSIQETETAKPVETGAVVKPTGAIAALVGLEETAKGTTATYADQLLFYVPPADSTDSVVLLGFSQALISAKELP